MAAIRGWGAYLPSRVVTNADLAARLQCEAGWILDVSGIEERRYAAPEESVTIPFTVAVESCAKLPTGKAKRSETNRAAKVPTFCRFPWVHLKAFI